MGEIEGIRFALLPTALVLVLLLPALFVEYRPGRSRGRAALTGVEYLRRELGDMTAHTKHIRVAALAGMILLVAALWAGPAIQSAKPLVGTDQLGRQKTLLIAIDVSRSMSGPLEAPAKKERFAAYGQTPDQAGERQSRFEAARETAYRFIDKFPDARIGLILFSTEPFLARWPTTDTANRFVEVLEENLREASQLRRFSSLTNTDAALHLAESVFSRLAVAGGAVLHISDAEDDVENMGSAIRGLRSNGIRLYTIGVGVSETIVDQLDKEFADDQGFRIFHADSEVEMQEAFRLVAELEGAPQYAEAETTYVTELRWLIALLLVPLAVLIFWLLEIRMHRSDFVQSAERRTE
ncbi:MAG: VWA domain-containing protein [Gammaproteobacteria bacterium]|nr:VWA domain-containing protein [Gammaproteobacteria bacterium]